MKTVLALATAALLSTAALTTLTAAPAHGETEAAPQPPRTISITGKGDSAMTPDIARLSLGVTSSAPTAREALDANNKSMQAVIDGLKSLGLGVTDIQTSGLSLSPIYDTSGSVAKLTGYQARNGVALKVKDISRLGEILDLTVSAGANEINGLSFDVQDKDAAIADARVAAMKDAKAKADLMAGALGAVVGRPLSISESYMSDQPMQMQTMNAASVDVPIATGQVGLTAQVSVVFELN
ncbi:26 kDa periplasmic immunogenic protein [Alphaproteobacteria bacterium SO-S41]|nr:26 kDa periplasmic immunogenic protein [Alphaproteobacteria bacterium SO-S41]